MVLKFVSDDELLVRELVKTALLGPSELEGFGPPSNPSDLR